MKDWAGHPTTVRRTKPTYPRRKGACLQATRPRWPTACQQASGRAEGGSGKDRDTGDLGEELRAVDINSELRSSALCCGPKKLIGGMTLVSFFLSYWNSATSQD